MSKGSRRRQSSVSDEQLQDNWAKDFRTDNQSEVRDGELTRDFYMKNFKKTEAYEVEELKGMLSDAAIKWAKKNNLSGLSEAGSHNLYNAIENMVEQERYGPYRWK